VWCCRYAARDDKGAGATPAGHVDGVRRIPRERPLSNAGLIREEDHLTPRFAGVWHLDFHRWLVVGRAADASPARRYLARARDLDCLRGPHALRFQGRFE